MNLRNNIDQIKPIEQMIILGKGCAVPFDCEKTGLNNNVAIVGGSGSGKTCSYVYPNLLHTEEQSQIVVFNKRKDVETLKPFFMNKGYVVYDLDLVQAERGNIGFDFLSYCRNADDISELSTSIVSSVMNTGNTRADPYWDYASIALLNAAAGISLFDNLYTLRFEPLTYVDTIRLLLETCTSLQYSGETSRTDLGKRIDELKKYTYKTREMADLQEFIEQNYQSFAVAAEKTGRSIMTSLQTTLMQVFKGMTLKILEKKNRLDIPSLGKEKSVLFITVSPVDKSTHFFSTFIYSMLFRELFNYADAREDGKLEVPVHIICDDLAVGCPIPKLAEMFSIVRAKNISISILLQSETQLEMLYSKEAGITILNNCDTYLYFGGMDTSTAEKISHRLNVPLDDIMWMPVGREIIFRRGQKPIVTERYDYLHDHIYQNLVRSQSVR